MLRGRLRAGLRDADFGPRYPAMNHGERDFGVELDAKSSFPDLHSLVLEHSASREAAHPMRECKAIAMPLIHLFGPGQGLCRR